MAATFSGTNKKNDKKQSQTNEKKAWTRSDYAEWMDNRSKRCAKRPILDRIKAFPFRVLMLVFYVSVAMWSSFIVITRDMLVLSDSHGNRSESEMGNYCNNSTQAMPFLSAARSVGTLEVIRQLWTDILSFFATVSHTTSFSVDACLQSTLLSTKSGPVMNLLQLSSTAYSYFYGLFPLANIISSLFIGCFLADFVVGLIHMYFDNYPLTTKCESHPLQLIAFGFHVHHADPQDWVKYDIFYKAILEQGFRSLFIFMTPFVLYLLFVGGTQTSNPRFILGYNAFCMSILIAQICHSASHNRWAHSKFSGIFKFLQTSGIIISPESHREHHTKFDRNFCIIYGWANPFVNFIYNRVVYPKVKDTPLDPKVQATLYEHNSKSIEFPYYQLFPEWR